MNGPTHRWSRKIRACLTVVSLALFSLILVYRLCLAIVVIGQPGSCQNAGALALKYRHFSIIRITPGVFVSPQQQVIAQDKAGNPTDLVVVEGIGDKALDLVLAALTGVLAAWLGLANYARQKTLEENLRVQQTTKTRLLQFAAWYETNRSELLDAGSASVRTMDGKLRESLGELFFLLAPAERDAFLAFLRTGPPAQEVRPRIQDLVRDLVVGGAA